MSAGKHTRLRSHIYTQKVSESRQLFGIISHIPAILKPGAFQLSAFAAATTGTFKLLCS